MFFSIAAAAATATVASSMAAQAASSQASALCSSFLPGNGKQNTLAHSQAKCFVSAKQYPLLAVKQHKRMISVRADYSDRKSGGAGDFVAGFVLGGMVFGALGYLFAPQVNKFITTVEREFEENSKKLPRGLDDDEGLEKTRRNLNEKIAQLNAAIDDISAQLRADDKSGDELNVTAELESAT